MNAKRARELLERRHTDLEAIVRAATDDTGSMDEPVDAADVATETLERELDQSVRGSAEASLQDVDRAVQRIEKGTYGICPVCKEPIPDERLEARPEAEFCVKHQPSAVPLEAE
jgi:RNA polymerase-binding protein DksA